jgi:hypothetical protein
MSRRMFPLVGLLVLSLGFALTASAQQGTAAITGVVTDAAGAIIPGVDVTLRNSQTGVVLQTKTESAGSYVFKLVPPGPGYTIKFEFHGFSAVEVSGLYLNVDDTRTQNAKLQAGTTVTVEVSAGNQNETINTTDAQVGESVQVQVLNDLPIQSRDSPSALFTMLPGVTTSGSVTGARTDQDNVTLDGLDVNDNETGNFGAVVANAPVDSVQEFRGVVGGQLSSSGEGGGGQYQLVTKGGTNKFHGSAFEYNRDTVMAANDYFNNAYGLPRTPLIRNQFGGTVGGPVIKDKLFFFFSYEGNRIIQSASQTRTVPTDSYRAGTVTYESTNGGTNTLSPAQVAALDPLAQGFNQSLLSLFSSRYPHANNPSSGNGLDTSGYTFTYPSPTKEDNFTQRADWKLTPKLSFEGVGRFVRTNEVHAAPEFSGDPETFPFLDQSYDWAGINTWVIGSNKTNQVEVGETYENYSFPCLYNPTGDTQWSGMGGIASGGTDIDGPYASCSNAQGRTYPIIMIKDDFDWQKGRHDITFGGQTKRISPNNFVILNYNSAGVGLGGFVNSLASPPGEPSMRPTDLAGGNGQNYYDSDYALALTPYTSLSATYNFNNKGAALPQGSGATQDFRFYETEIYAGDSWKVTPRLTFTYGVRWQDYTPPYERHGLEALAHFGNQSLSNSTFNYYFGQRLTDAAQGISGVNALPLISYVLGGKANGQPSYYQPEYHDFAPRVAFAYSPSWDDHTVWRGGVGMVYDHTVVSAIQYQQTQYNYLFKNSVNDNLGITGNAYSSFQTLGRFAGLTSAPTPPSAPAVTPPYTPWVEGAGTTNPFPYGLLYGEFNETVDPHFKNPFSVLPTFGMQHEFAKGFILKADYVGRFGRRLMAQADMSQLVDFPDEASGQMMSQAFSYIVQQTRACQAAGSSTCTYAPQPWFENVLPAGSGVALGYASNTDLAANINPTYTSRGDFADWLFTLAGEQNAAGTAYLLPPNIGMASQFAENTVYTNKGFSSYNGLLVTLHKNAGFGLTFDINYTWSHAIDNVSVTANTVAYGGYGFICDVVRPRTCRGLSDFDISNQINGYVLYDLPYGHGRTFGGSSSWIANELLGGWSVSALPRWQTGFPYFAGANAFVAGFANNAAAILTGNRGDMNIHLHRGACSPTDSNTCLLAYANQTQALSDYTGPVGFQVGSRNNLRGPRQTQLDAGVSKSFPIVRGWVFKLRGDAFNVMNHPVFANPNADITESSNPFGSVTADAANTNAASRVLQVSGRIEF